tara:strand:- start:1743 stop:3236 length:1494 start_codon:yes stop_codon:yes gene_type:complete
MKSMSKLFDEKSAYHANPSENTVHRSSLLVTEMPETTAEITFLNHFFLKRNYKNVGCRITGIDPEGGRIKSVLYPITEPRVYEFNLSKEFSGHASNYLVEFFAAENLFIPFPAVMINHRGQGFHNTVHVNNRILNDVFENDQINARDVQESAIDVQINDDGSTFFIFATGILPVQNVLDIELQTNAETINKEISVNLPRLSSRLFILKDIFPNVNISNGAATLKIKQPKQPLFFDRLIAGILRNDGAFTANHSYYDSTEVLDYWKDQHEAYAVYPFIKSLDNSIRVYPIMTPSNLRMFISIHNKEGQTLAKLPVGEISSPGGEILEASVNEVITNQGYKLSDVASFCLWAQSELEKLPTRINHQMIYRDKGLGCSINTSLTNESHKSWNAANKLSWGQLLVGRDYKTWLGFVFRRPNGASHTLKITYYDKAGKIHTTEKELPARGSVIVNVTAEFGEPESDEARYIWYTAECQRQDLSAWTVSQNLTTGHCSGEHSF